MLNAFVTRFTQTPETDAAFPALLEALTAFFRKTANVSTALASDPAFHFQDCCTALFDDLLRRLDPPPPVRAATANDCALLELLVHVNTTQSDFFIVAQQNQNETTHQRQRKILNIYRRFMLSTDPTITQHLTLLDKCIEKFLF